LLIGPVRISTPIHYDVRLTEDVPAMWTTLAFVAALGVTPGAADKLSLTNVRNTYGVLGATRPDAKYFPGDQFFLAFDIDGVQPDDAGKVLYSIAMQVTDSKGKVQFKQTPQPHEALNSLGGRTLPCFASLKIGLDEPPGDYQVKITVTDRASKARGTLTRSYKVLRPQFALVRLTTTVDPEQNMPAPFIGAGQSLWVNFAAVGFGRDSNKEQPNLAVVLRVRDEDGKATLAKPEKGAVTKDVPKKMRAVPMQFMLELNRPGQFTVEIKATDKLTGKTASLSFPLRVLKVGTGRVEGR
jgi:hypothetical protein